MHLLHRYLWPRFCVLLLAAGNASELPGAETRSASESRLLHDARDGRLDEFTLFEAALIANGIESVEQCQQFQAILDAAASEFAPQLAKLEPPLTRAGKLFRLMHARLLAGTYQADCTQLSRTLTDGDYNCVSATVLFHVLCRRFGLDPVAVSTPTHVYSRLNIAGEPFEIQTTCPTWFELPADQRAAASPAPSSDMREISDVELVAKVFYNRGVRCLEAERFAQAEAAFRKSLLLDPRDTTANENLLATLNNWALAECDQQDFEQAIRLLDQGLELDPKYSAFQANQLHAYQRWAQYHCRQGDFQAAIQVLSAGQRRRPEAALFREGPIAVYRMWAQDCEHQGDLSGAVQLLDRALERYPQQPELVADRARLQAGTTTTALPARARIRDARFQSE